MADFGNERGKMNAEWCRSVGWPLVCNHAFGNGNERGKILLFTGFFFFNLTKKKEDNRESAGKVAKAKREGAVFFRQLFCFER